MTDYINPEVQQAYSDTCAIKSQQLILNDFGIPCTEDELVQVSYENGWYNGNGTLMPDIGNLLEIAGIECTKQTDANIFNIVSELSQGHKIIVGVDSDELWHNDTIGGKFHNWLKDFFKGNTPDHALIVAGIDTSDPNDVKVLLTDPGTGEQLKPYSLSQFMDAWSDAECYMVSTNCAVPPNVSGMEKFNMENGHIDNIAGMNYSDFQIFNDLSYGVPVWQTLADGTLCSPITSLVNGYFDTANNCIDFGTMLSSPNYIFTDFLYPQTIMDSVIPAMEKTYLDGLNQIAFSPNNDWTHYVDINGIDEFSNIVYGDFLNQSIVDFSSCNDTQSASYCEQQQMMLDLCNHYGFDFYDTFMI